MDHSDIRQEILTILEKTPQYQFIRSEDINEWIQFVLTNCPDRAVWLARRVGWLGGSDIGVLVQAQRNLAAEYINEIGYSHSSDREIVQSKLLTALPKLQNEDMLRGTLLEPIAEQIHLNELRAEYKNVRKRQDIIDAVVNYASKKYPWARVQLDSVIEADGKLIFSDYKVPSSKSIDSLMYQEPVMYASQVTLGKMIANELGYTVDQMFVLPLDHDKMCLRYIEVDEDLEFEEEIKTVGDYYFYELILQGKMPPPPFPKYAIKSTDDLENNLVKNIHKESILRILSKVIKEDLDLVTDAIQFDLQKLQTATDGGDNYKIGVGCMNVIGAKTKSFNKERAISFLEDKTNAIDQDIALAKGSVVKLKKLLKSQKVPKEILATFEDTDFTTSLLLTRDPEGPQAQLKKATQMELANRTESLVDELASIIAEHAQLKDNPDEIHKRQSNQLSTLQRILDNAPNEVVEKKAAATLKHRNTEYSQDRKHPTNPEVIAVNAALSQTSGIEFEEEYPDLGDLIRFNL